MKPVLVLYATREGHTRHIAEHLGATIAARQRLFDLVDAAHIPHRFSLENYSAAILAASLHLGKHEPEITKFVKRHLGELQRLPTAFLSVSLSETTVEDANAPPDKRAAAQVAVQRSIDEFLDETGWHPSHIAAVAGALLYSKYNFVVRFVMKRIAAAAGGPVDTTRDYEFTDWAKLDRLIGELLQETTVNRAPA